MHRVAPVAILLLSVGLPAAAQQPFVVDDADTTPKRAWHLEISNQLDRLRSSSYPARWQNALEWELDYGATDRIELAAIVPLLSIVRADGSGVANDTGIGDTALGAKIRLSGDSASRRSFAATVSVEFPTGDSKRSLGSGLTDYSINAIVQDRLRERLTLRVNVGVVFAGNTQTGLLGIRERGTVLTGGASLVRRLQWGVDVGGEVTVAWSDETTLGRSTIGWQLGASVPIGEGVTLDVGVVGGTSDASPRIGVQVGTSIDFIRRPEAASIRQ